MNHKILISKLYNYGIRRVAHQWFKTYSTDRILFTCLADDVSSYLETTCVIQQGSVFGLLLFLIYMIDIGSVTPNVMVKLFADYTHVFVLGNSC